MGDTTGIWFGDDESLLEEFDEHFSDRDGSDYSRSKRIKDAMRLALRIDAALESADADLDIGDHPTGAMCREAILEEYRD